jgi:hypothetical protein
LFPLSASLEFSAARFAPGCTLAKGGLSHKNNSALDEQQFRGGLDSPLAVTQKARAVFNRRAKLLHLRRGCE